jgi:hypothetical protein
MNSAKICSAEPSLAKSDILESETGGSGIFSGLNDLGKTAMADPVDWGTPLIRYLENPGHVINT